MTRSPGFGSFPGNRCALFGLAFAMPAPSGLSRLPTKTRWPMMQKVHPQRRLALLPALFRRREGRATPWIVLSASRFSAVARPARGSGFTVPSQYCSLSVSVGSRRWRRVPPYSDPGHGPYCHVRDGGGSVRADRPLWDPVPGGFPNPSSRLPVLSFRTPWEGGTENPPYGGHPIPIRRWRSAQGTPIAAFARHY